MNRSHVTTQRWKPVDLRGKRVLVMGLGVHGGGLGVTRFLVEQGAEVTVTDLRTAEQLASSLEQLAGLSVHYALGEHREADFRATDMVIRNPGVPQESPLLQIARAAGASIEMEMTLFFRLCPAPIIGITGTKGKTTTTMLTGAILRQQFPDTVIAGNLRVSALEQLPHITPATPVVLELSSWQLEGLGDAQMSPPFACITNISPDHLDRYGSMEDYAEAKAQIFLHQRPDDITVLSASDPILRAMAVRVPGEVVWFDQGTDWSEADTLEPLRIAYWENNTLFWHDHTRSSSDRWHKEEICTQGDVQIAGQHNLTNIAAAVALAKVYGVETEHIRAAIRQFKGVPDRLESIAELEGVRYINDTTATTPTAAAAAVRSFTDPTIVIAGGADKNLEFGPFVEALTQRAKVVVLLSGTATPKLQNALEDMAQQSERRPSIVGPVGSMQEALDAARDLAESGDVVLLSPGCASFGMFRNEFDRGEQFRQIVRAWEHVQPTTTSR